MIAIIMIYAKTCLKNSNVIIHVSNVLKTIDTSYNIKHILVHLTHLIKHIILCAEDTFLNMTLVL